LLTRLKVSGFKNLLDVDLRFGPFTCIAGLNGVGKSNLFDAITLLSALADRTLIDAALSVRDEGGRSADLRSIFHRVGDAYDDKMSFEAEMIVPFEAPDEFGQQAKATFTFLRYGLVLAYRSDGPGSRGKIEILSERLTHIPKGDAHKHLLFPHKAREWREKAVHGRRSAHFISTSNNDEPRLIMVHQDGGSRGKPQSYPAATLPRTVLSAANNALESPTLVVAKREMQSWRQLQLEPSALRQPSSFHDPARLGNDGANLPSALYHLARTESWEGDPPPLAHPPRSGNVYAAIANRLSDLIDDVKDVWVDRDEKRELLTLNVRGQDGTIHPARSLSDGTLRFLALSVLSLDPAATGVVCLEEPENGIHPARIPAILELLNWIAMDASEPVDPFNPLRQVIVNTHSPAVVAEVAEEDIVFADLVDTVGRDGSRYGRLSFSCLPDTWRAKAGALRAVDKGVVLKYLNPSGARFGTPPPRRLQTEGHRNRRRVADRDDLQQVLAFREEAV
jgi:predicted ATPase